MLIHVWQFWIFVYRESKRLGMKRWWGYVAATFVFGLITPLASSFPFAKGVWQNNKDSWLGAVEGNLTELKMDRLYFGSGR